MPSACPARTCSGMTSDGCPLCTHPRYSQSELPTWRYSPTARAGSKELGCSRYKLTWEGTREGTSQGRVGTRLLSGACALHGRRFEPACTCFFSRSQAFAASVTCVLWQCTQGGEGDGLIGRDCGPGLFPPPQGLWTYSHRF